jgi:hypothetical protein
VADTLVGRDMLTLLALHPLPELRDTSLVRADRACPLET